MWPGLKTALGPAWWALLVVAACGLTPAIAYLMSPQVGVMSLFPATIRYAGFALVLGLVLLPVALSKWRRATSPAVLVTYVVLLVATQFDSTLWPWRNFSTRAGVVITLAVVVAVVAVVLFAAFRNFSLDHRYATPPLSYMPLLALHDARIAFVGTNVQYEYYGDDSVELRPVPRRAGTARRLASHQRLRDGAPITQQRPLHAPSHRRPGGPDDDEPRGALDA